MRMKRHDERAKRRSEKRGTRSKIVADQTCAGILPGADHNEPFLIEKTAVITYPLSAQRRHQCSAGSVMSARPVEPGTPRIGLRSGVISFCAARMAP